MKLGKKAFLLALLPVMGLSLVSCTSMGTYADADKYLIGSQTYEGELKDLNIDWISGEVTLIEDASSESIIVKEENDLPDEKKVHSYFHDGILNIKYWKSGYRSRFIETNEKHLYVTFPSLENLDVDLTSGRLNGDKVTASNGINIDVTSGSINLGTVKCQTIDADLTSGSITIDSLDVDKGKFECTSGTININSSKANELGFDVTSGKVNLTIPTEGATVSFSKVSGSLKSERTDYEKRDNKYIYGDGSCQVKIKVTSGKATIK